MLRAHRRVGIDAGDVLQHWHQGEGAETAAIEERRHALNLLPTRCLGEHHGDDLVRQRLDILGVVVSLGVDANQHRLAAGRQGGGHFRQLAPGSVPGVGRYAVFEIDADRVGLSPRRAVDQSPPPGSENSRRAARVSRPTGGAPGLSRQFSARHLTG